MNGAPKEALDTLKADAKVNLDDIRDKAAETANCSPEARSSKQALQTELDAYRKALADMESARQQAAPEQPTNLLDRAEAGLERNSSTIGAGLGVAKSTADAAMDLFGAAAGLMPPDSPLKLGMDRVGAAYKVGSGLVAQGNADTVAGAASGTTSAMAGGLKLAALQDGVDIPGAKQAKLYAAGLEIASKTLSTTVVRSETSPAGATGREVETAGNVVQMFGTGISALGELPYAEDAIKRTGGVFSAAGKVASTSAKYDRELGKALDQYVTGKDERRQVDDLKTSTLQRIDTKRVEFMEKIAALEAEIGRSGCIQK